MNRCLRDVLLAQPEKRGAGTMSNFAQIAVMAAGLLGLVRAPPRGRTSRRRSPER